MLVVLINRRGLQAFNKDCFTALLDVVDSHLL